jgi:Mitochondrial carrier protein
VSKRGLNGVYNGLGATLLRDVPFTSIQFTIYETLKPQFEPSMARDAIVGAFAGTVAGFVTTPLDVCKTYLQTQQKPQPKFVGSAPTPYYNSIWACLKGVYERRGIPGLFTGARIRSFWTGAHSLIMLSMYEFGLKYMHDTPY